MTDAIFRARAFAPAATPVILHGENGTGNTLFAEYIHRLSGRLESLLAFTVGMPAPQLAFDELFGRVPGAYTDARRMRTGRIATTGTATLLLDDPQNVDVAVQNSSCRWLDRGSYGLGGSDRVATLHVESFWR